MEDDFLNVIDAFKGKSFSTYDFTLTLKDVFPLRWEEIENEYGSGGAGAGHHYTAYSRVAHALNKFANSGYLDKLDYRKSPEGWGSPIIRYWAISTETLGGQNFPEEILNTDKIMEGAKKVVTVNKYERDSRARLQCIERWGICCVICEFNFEEFYGPKGAGFIHVHHLKPLGEIKEEYELDPINDLRPVCPNCHAMLHRSETVISIDELKQIIADVNA